MKWIAMISKFHLGLMPVILFASMLCGCALSAQRPIQQVQMCLGDQRNLDSFTDLLRSIARSHNMVFSDNIISAKRGLLARREMLGEPPISGPVIDIGLMRKGGVGLTASNLGLPGFQVVVGFYKGSSLPESIGFAAAAIDAFGEHWDVIPVPAGEGAFSLEGCS